MLDSSLELEYLFSAVREQQLLTELVCRLYRLEQMEATQSTNDTLLCTFSAKVSKTHRYANASLILLKWWSRLWTDFVNDAEKSSLSATIMRLFVFFCQKRGLMNENESTEACDSHLKAVLLAIDFLVFVLFDFKMTDGKPGDDLVFAEISVFKKTRVISFEAMESITKAVASTLQSLINSLSPH